MHIHTRAEIYGNEAAQLLHEISMYPGIFEQQLFRFHPGKENKIKAVLNHLIKQSRIQREEGGSYYCCGVNPKVKDHALIKAVWVLLDFLDHVQYHSASDFPVKIIFFADDEEYEIICVSQGQDVLISQAMQQLKDRFVRRIVLIESPHQISALEFPNICGYCTVDENGYVTYYQKRNGET